MIDAEHMAQLEQMGQSRAKALGGGWRLVGVGVPVVNIILTVPEADRLIQRLEKAEKTE